jgi:hypothetical protein
MSGLCYFDRHCPHSAAEVGVALESQLLDLHLHSLSIQNKRSRFDYGASNEGVAPDRSVAFELPSPASLTDDECGPGRRRSRCRSESSAEIHRLIRLSSSERQVTQTLQRNPPLLALTDEKEPTCSSCFLFPLRLPGPAAACLFCCPLPGC